jgi:hypothetical protein
MQEANENLFDIFTFKSHYIKGFWVSYGKMRS